MPKTYEVKSMINDQPTFEVPLGLILAEMGMGYALKILSPTEYITDRQRRWYKGVCLRDLVKNDENGETMGWWDLEVKRQCNGLALLNKEIFYFEDGLGNKIGTGRLTTKNVGRRNMTLFIEEILSKSMELGWDVSPPDPDLRRKLLNKQTQKGG